jgi:hypothetical protein
MSDGLCCRVCGERKWPLISSHTFKEWLCAPCLEWGAALVADWLVR